MNYTYQQANHMGLYFKTNGKRCVITKYKGSDKSVIIPDTIDSKPVRAIGNNAFKKSVIENIVIPDNVLSIGAGAFAECNLKSVEISANIETIGDYAFSDCKNLEKVSCKKENLRLVKIGKEIFSDTPYIKGRGLVILNNMVLKYNSEESDVYIPYNVDIIHTYAFLGSSYVNRVIFPSKNIYIRESAFENCKNLKATAFYEVRENNNYNSFFKPGGYLFIEYKAFYGTELYKNLIKDNLIKTNKYENSYIYSIRCAVRKNAFIPPDRHDIYTNNHFNIEDCFDILFQKNGKWTLILNLKRYDDFFKDADTEEKIKYMYFRIILSGFDRDVIKSCMDYFSHNKELTIKTLLYFNRLDVIGNLTKWGIIDKSNFDYAISVAEKYNYWTSAEYLRQIKNRND